MAETTSRASDTWLDRQFHISERGSNVPTEVRGGITTFLTMAYIIFVNPSILSAAIDVDGAIPQLVTVTCMAAAVGTLVMALWGNLPFALAPGLGLNAFFAFTVVGTLGFAWQTALGAVFISGLIFIVVSITGLREWILAAIPLYLKHAITAGIGAFLAIIGFANAGLIADSEATLVTRGDWTVPGLWLAVLGIIAAAALLALRVQGALLISILAITVISVVSGAAVYNGEPFGGFVDGVVGFTWPADLIGAMDIGAALEAGLLTVVFTFFFVDFFDTAGTLIGLSDRAGMMDEDGNIDAPTAAFTADGIATTVGAALGTSSTTTFIESASGIEEGAKTGLASLVTAALFLGAMIFAPLAGAIPQVATAPVLIVIGAMMMRSAQHVDWSEYRESVPAFLAIVGMPFTYSITDGISLGIITHAAIMAVSGRARDVRPVMYILAALLLWRFFFVG
ncbi:MAG: NCS2 family permease [Actinobacteria bacterium]|nr:NCS2 family permease [Actinomycetota bacterium]